MSDLLAWAERFIATPSVSSDGNRAIATLAAELLASFGLDSRLEPFELDGEEHFTLIADLGPRGDDGLMLVTHLDTVPPGDPALWTRTGGDPFRPTREGDRLYGLGSADAKVDLVAKAFALRGIARSSLVRPLRLVGTFAEEIGLLGARQLVASGETRGFRFALVGEPSELVAIHAHKGYAAFEATLPAAPGGCASGGAGRALHCSGESAHSSTPHLGQNAIERALDRIASESCAVARLEGGSVLNKVPDSCELELASEPGHGYPAAPLVEFHRAWRTLLANLEAEHDALFDPPYTVGNLARVEFRGGRPVFGFDLRAVPGVDPIVAAKSLERVAELRCLRASAPLFTPPDGVLCRAVMRAQRSMGRDPRVGTKATSTEAGIFSQAGLEAVVLGAGPSVGNVHRPNEHTRISELELASGIYRATIHELCTAEGRKCSV